MLDDLLKILDYEEVLKEKLPAIKKAFATLYQGDEERIEEQFSNCLILPYIRFDEINSIVYTVKELKMKELQEKTKNGLNIDEEKIKRMFSSSISFDDCFIYQYYDYVDKIKESNNPDFRFPLSYLNKNINGNNILEGNLDEEMKFMDEIRPFMEQIRNEYQEFYSKIKKYDDIRQKMNDIERNINTKYTLEFAEKYKDFIGEEYDKIKRTYESTGNVYAGNYPKLTLLANSTFSVLPPIYSFSEKSEERMKSGDDYYIKRDRINYFKSMGIDLGNDYEAYENDERCKSIIPSKEFIEEVVNYQLEIKQKIRQELNMADPYIARMKEIAGAVPFVEPVDIEDHYNKGQTCLTTNIIRTEKGLQAYPILFLNIGENPIRLDMNIIHEFNHLFELTILEIDDEKYKASVGWDIIEELMNGTELSTESGGKRHYELFNEIINDILAQEVCTVMHGNGEYIFSNKENKIYNGAGYRMTTFLANPFIEHFSKSIVGSRRGDMSNMFNTVGEENFEKYCQLFFKFYEEIGEGGYYQYCSDRNNGLETDLTRKMDELKQETSQIIEQMLEYQKAHNKTV